MIIIVDCNNQQIMSSKNEQQRFEIAPQEEGQVGTEILDPTLPSDLDFDKKQKQAIEMVELNSKAVNSPSKPAQINFENIQIASFTIKGKVVFNLQPQHKLADILPLSKNTYFVKSFNDQFSNGFKGIWETIIGYTNKELYINQGYFYLLQRQKHGLIVIAIWKLVNLFKIFMDLQQSKLRLVWKQQGSEHLQMRDYESANIKQLVQKLGDQVSSIGLALVG